MPHTNPPKWNAVMQWLPRALRFFGPIEWAAGWIFYLIRRSYGIRLLLDMAAAAAVVAAVVGLWIDMGQRRVEREAQVEERKARQEERRVRMWNLATANRPGNSGKRPALEFLHRNGHSLVGIFIPGAYLNGVDLSPISDVGRVHLAKSTLKKAQLMDAQLSRADLLRADLSGADLRGADLSHAELTDTDLSGANLAGADFEGTFMVGTDLSGAKFEDVRFRGTVDYFAGLPGNQDATIPAGYYDHAIAKHMTQEQLDSACADPESPPTGLPRDSTTDRQLLWRGEACTSSDRKDSGGQRE